MYLLVLLIVLLSELPQTFAPSGGSTSASSISRTKLPENFPSWELLETQFSARTISWNYYLLQNVDGDHMVALDVLDNSSVTERIVCKCKKDAEGVFSIEQWPFFKFKSNTLINEWDFSIFERPDGGFKIVSDNKAYDERNREPVPQVNIESLYKTFHPIITDWDEAYTDHGVIIAKKEESYWIWHPSIGWAQKQAGWKPIHTKEFQTYVKEILEKNMGEIAAGAIQLRYEKYSTFSFSTVAIVVKEKGFQKIFRVSQSPDQNPEIDFIDDIKENDFHILNDNTSDSDRVAIWVNTAGKCQLRRITYSSVEPLYPERAPLEWCCFWIHEGSIELRARKSDSKGFDHWSYTYSSRKWQLLSDEEREYTWDDHFDHIRAQYPDAGFGKLIKDSENKVFFAILRDPSNIRQERLVVLARKPKEARYNERELLVAQADSIFLEERGCYIQYNNAAGKHCFGKIILDEPTSYRGIGFFLPSYHRLFLPEPSLSPIDSCRLYNITLPIHPTISEWDELEIDRSNNLSFAKKATNYGRNTQYWGIKDSSWHLLHESVEPGQFLYVVGVNDRKYVYRYTYTEEGLFLEFLDPMTACFHPTNVNNFPSSIVLGCNIFPSKDPKIIYAVRDYKEGVTDWVFFPEAASLKQQCDNVQEKLRQKWREEGRSFAELPLSIDSLMQKDEGQIFGINFSFYQHIKLSGVAGLIDEDIIVEWRNPIEEAFSFHPPLQLKTANVKGQDVPYYYVPSNGVPNDKSLIIMEGGPWSHYEGGYANIIDHYTRNGWSVIIPQESLRTGYGWQHYAKGLGEIGRGNLHQLLHIFYHAHENGYIRDLSQTHLIGDSYGGFVATTFGLRWDELHVEAKLEKKFNFQSIAASGAWVDGTSLRPHFSRSLIPDDALANPESYIKHVMPIHRTAMTLSAPLFLIHGRTDVRCSAAYAKSFYDSLKENGQHAQLFWHKGGHESPRHERYPEFLLSLMEDSETADLESTIGLTKEENKVI